jgi:diguanylate cyclase (GGDEF)-like protein
MLRECSLRLKKCLRENDTVARLGGDEFVVMMEDYSSARDIVTVAQKILAHIAAPVLLESREFTPSASIGISIYPDDGANVETLLKNADIAMYRAKDQGRNNHQFYSGVPLPPASEQQEVEALAGVSERGAV